jgi:hypothetical protein
MAARNCAEAWPLDILGSQPCLVAPRWDESPVVFSKLGAKASYRYAMRLLLPRLC